MNELPPRPYILVGIDGSKSATDAATWAVREARIHNLPLRLVHVIDHGSFALGSTPTASESFFKYHEACGAKLLVEAKLHVQKLDPTVEVTTEKKAGRPLPVLIELSKDAFVTVVGSSGLNAFTGLLAGSVSVALTAHGHSPVVVVRGQSPADGPVVVGVSDTPTSDDAISWAFEEAAMRGVDLIAVLVSNPPAYYYSELAVADMTDEAVAEQQQMLLAERLAGWQEKFPDVTVIRVGAMGNPAEVLLSHSQRAQLIVTGSRGRGDVSGFFLGSTSHRLVHHADCPVLVARPHARDSGR